MSRMPVETLPEKLHLLKNPAWLRAYNLAERRGLLKTGAPTQINLEKAQRRLQRWKNQKFFAKNDYFQRRLAEAQLNEQELFVLLGLPVESLQVSEASLSAWIRQLATALENYDYTSELLFPALENNEKNQAQMLLNTLSPLLADALKRLKSLIEALIEQNGQPGFFDPEKILGMFFNNLGRQLIPKFSRVMALELNVARLQGLLEGEDSPTRFQSFVKRLGQQGKIVDLLLEYPVLARDLMVTTENWLNYCQEFLTHFWADWPELCATFSPDADPGQLIELDGGGGDVHRAGRSVLRLKFSGGFQLIYKPRSFDIDEHFQQLLGWMNQKGDHLDFRTLKIINRGTYGWCEFIKAEPCQTETQLQHFYERQGGYLALLYALEATDFHYENLIASGEHPVPIDLEALFQPRFALPGSPSEEDPALGKIQNSVIRNGLLPKRVWGGEEVEGVDISGLNGKGGQLTPRPILQWQGLGTDQFRMVRERVVLPGSHNRPNLKGQEIDVLNYTAEIKAGFTKIYRVLIDHRQELINGPLTGFANDQIRLIARNTQSYARLLQEACHPDLLRDGLERDRFFDHLWAAVDSQPQLARLIPTEHRELWTGDIPMFTTTPASRHIYSSQGNCIPDFIPQSSLDHTLQRLTQMSEADLAQQLWFIEASFATIPSGTDQRRWVGSQLRPSEREVTPEQLLEEARAIGDRLAKLALHNENGVNWAGLTPYKEKEWKIFPAGLELYNGLPGIGLFLAYLGAICGEERYTTLAGQALATTRHKASQLKKYLKSVGAFDGWSSLIYSFTHLGVLWNQPDLLAEAAGYAELVAELVGQDEAFDLLSGSAGAILSLLGLHSVTADSRVLGLAVKCGDHLISHSQSQAEGVAWSKGHELPLAGFSHGAAGIAYSLLALSQASKEARFAETAKAALEYERSLFSPEHRNWPDLRSEVVTGRKAGTYFMSTWCHGAAGIGLGRLASLRYLDDGQIRDEILVALETTFNESFGLNHSLCHGDLGNLETLLVAGQVLGDAAYHQQVKTLTASILDSRTRQGWLSGLALGLEIPGLMTGLAGMGYQLLRLCDPAKIPSVLLLAPPFVSAP